MRVIYLSETVDCTADPHPVRYRAALNQALDDVVKVCTSNLIQGIHSVEVQFKPDKTVDTEVFECDRYSDYPPPENTKPAKGEMAEKYKVKGLYFREDANVDAKHHLPIGLEGIKAAAELIKKRFTETQKLPESVSIGVVWAFAGAASCADYITIDFNSPSNIEVDYSNQDWWTSKPGYKKHCKALSKLITQPIFFT